MSRGTQDFGSIVSNTAATQVDLGEINYVLSGIGYIDGLGRTFLFDNFRAGLGMWQRIQSGAAQVPIIVSEAFNSNGNLYAEPYVCYMNGGAPFGGSSYLRKMLFLGNATKIGIEVGLVLNSNMSDLYVALRYHPTGGVTKGGQIHISVNLGTVTYIDKFLAEPVLMNIPALDAGIYYACPVKLTCDLVNLKYGKVLFGDRVFDLSKQDIPGAIVQPEGVMAFTIQSFSRGAPFNDLYLGYVRISRDEP